MRLLPLFLFFFFFFVSVSGCDTCVEEADGCDTCVEEADGAVVLGSSLASLLHSSICFTRFFNAFSFKFFFNHVLRKEAGYTPKGLFIAENFTMVEK